MVLFICGQLPLWFGQFDVSGRVESSLIDATLYVQLFSGIPLKELLCVVMKIPFNCDLCYKRPRSPAPCIVTAGSFFVDTCFEVSCLQVENLKFIYSLGNVLL
jgi:hypothetical protein